MGTGHLLQVRINPAHAAEGSLMAGDTGKRKPSLVEYAREKKREKCKACQIPVELRREMARVRDKKLPQEHIIGYLRDIHHISVTADDLQAHHAGHHDRQLRELGEGEK